MCKLSEAERKDSPNSCFPLFAEKVPTPLDPCGRLDIKVLW